MIYNIRKISTPNLIFFRPPYLPTGEDGGLALADFLVTPFKMISFCIWNQMVFFSVYIEEDSPIAFERNMLEIAIHVAQIGMV